MWVDDFKCYKFKNNEHKEQGDIFSINGHGCVYAPATFFFFFQVLDAVIDNLIAL